MQRTGQSPPAEYRRERHHMGRAAGKVLEALLPPDEAVSRRLSGSRQEFLRFFRRRLSRPEDAEDALQDFCIKAIRAAGSLDDAERIDAWLGRILRNTLTDHYRRRAAWRKAEAAYQREPHVAAFHPGDEPLDQMCLCMHRAIPSLKPDYAEILSRADLRDLSFRWLGQLHQTKNAICPLGTTRQMLYAHPHCKTIAKTLQRTAKRFKIIAISLQNQPNSFIINGRPDFLQ